MQGFPLKPKDITILPHIYKAIYWLAWHKIESSSANISQKYHLPSYWSKWGGNPRIGLLIHWGYGICGFSPYFTHFYLSGHIFCSFPPHLLFF